MDAAIASQHDVKTSARKTMLILWVKFSPGGGALNPSARINSGTSASPGLCRRYCRFPPAIRMAPSVVAKSPLPWKSAPP